MPFAASPLLLEALAVALHAAARTDGDVDPTVGRSLGALGWDSDFTVVVARRGETPRLRIVPAAGWRAIRIDRRQRTVRIPAGVEIDLGATAKALAADRCAQRGARGDGVRARSSTSAATSPSPARRPTAAGRSSSPTTIAATPRPTGQTVAIAAGGLATSSTTVRRWRAGGAELHHIVDPRSGAPARRDLAHGQRGRAHAASRPTPRARLAIVRGEARDRRGSSAPGCPARLVRPDGTTVTTGGWPAEAAA